MLYQAPERRMLQDVVTCIREGCTIDNAGFRRARFADRFLKPPARRMRSARLASAGGKPYGRCGRLAANRSPCLPRQISGVDRYCRKSRKSGSS